MALTLSGCGRNEIRVYRVPKEKTETAHVHGGGDLPAGHSDAGNAMPRLEYKTPQGWEEVTPGEMRIASFKVRGTGSGQADVGVFPLPGLAGGDLGNVNRWRSQVGLDPVKEEELPKLAQAIEVEGVPGQVYDFAGENPSSGEKTRILAGIVRREGVAWFFKMNGEDQLVAQQKPAFLEFLKSVAFKSAPAAELPPSHPPIDKVSGGGAPAVAGSAHPEWEIPTGWKEVPPGQFLVAKYAIAGEGSAQASVNVSRSAGDGGGLAGNVNRWRNQLGLGELPVTEIARQLANVETTAGKASQVEMTGKDARSGQPSKLVGVVVPRPNETWFFKLMGDEKVVDREKAAFTKFLQSMKFSHGS